MGELHIKYQVFNFLDHQDIEDYLTGIQLIQHEFQLDIHTAETYLNKWYGSDSALHTLFIASLKIACLYNRNLSSYASLDDFWKSVVPELTYETVELLTILPMDEWPIRIKNMIQKGKRAA